MRQFDKSVVEFVKKNHPQIPDEVMNYLLRVSPLRKDVEDIEIKTPDFVGPIGTVRKYEEYYLEIRETDKRRFYWLILPDRISLVKPLDGMIVYYSDMITPEAYRELYK